MKNNPCNCKGHQLTSFDPDTRTGVCIVCGETEISKTASRPGMTHWRCSHAYGRKKEKLPGKEHVLLSIDEEAKTGVCKTCGNIQILKAGKNPEGRQLWRCRTAVKKTAVPRKTNMKPHEHILSQINEINRTAVCAKCGPVKIQKRGSQWKGKDSWRCSISVREWPGRKAYQRKDMLRRLYGLTPEQYDLMVSAQGGCCAICKEVVDGQHHERLHVDHDHTTGAVRSLICRECNIMLGHAKDSPAILRAGADYLDCHSAIPGIPVSYGPPPPHLLEQRQAMADAMQEVLQ